MVFETKKKEDKIKWPLSLKFKKKMLPVQFIKGDVFELNMYAKKKNGGD